MLFLSSSELNEPAWGTGSVTGRTGSPWQALVWALQDQRALLAWNRSRPRPARYRHIPDRVWRRHSALLTLRADGERMGRPHGRGA